MEGSGTAECGECGAGRDSLLAHTEYLLTASGKLNITATAKYFVFSYQDLFALHI